MGNVYPTESTCDMIKTIIRKEKGAVKHMREITVVENVLLCADGAVMKDGPDCLVEKLPDGRIQARFENPAGEQRTVKFTLTGLTPHVGFQVRMEHAGNTETGPRRAIAPQMPLPLQVFRIIPLFSGRINASPAILLCRTGAALLFSRAPAAECR